MNEWQPIQRKSISVWDAHPNLTEESAILWENGYSARDIAESLGCGLTRAGVLGRMRRHKITWGLNLTEAQREAAKRHSARNLSSTPGPRKPASVVPKPVEIEPEPIGPLEDFPARDTCRFIFGDVKAGGWRCCGHPVVATDKPYCQHHHNLTRVAIRQPASPFAFTKAA